MKLIKYLTILGAFLLAGACAKDVITIGRIDESDYDNLDITAGYVRSATDASKEISIELYSQTVQAEVIAGLNRTLEVQSDFTLRYDSEYTAAKVEELGSTYEALPEETVAIAGAGEITIKKGSRKSERISLSINPSASLKAGVTYIYSVKLESASKNINISEQDSHVTIFVKSYNHLSDCFKGEDKLKTVLFFEVNDTNPLNALEFTLADSGKLFFDYVILFAANINYSAETGKVYVSCNPNVQFLLDNNETFIQPLRKRGIKVLLTILGNHDVSGVAQLSQTGAKQFASELAAFCYEYNLDGVNFDDEYSNSPDLSNPLFVSRSTQAGMRLCYEAKQAMPDKLVTIYDFGYMYGDHIIDGVEPGDFIDFVVPDYGRQTYPATGMTKKDCAGLAVELRRSPYVSADQVKRVVDDGWGYVMMFALDPSVYKSQLDPVNTICSGLYGQELAPVTHYYKKNDAVRYEIPKE